MVAAEFWEQGDLERSVLDQQPIVRAAPPPVAFFLSVNVLVCFLALQSNCLTLFHLKTLPLVSLSP